MYQLHNALNSRVQPTERADGNAGPTLALLGSLKLLDRVRVGRQEPSGLDFEGGQHSAIELLSRRGSDSPQI